MQYINQYQHNKDVVKERLRLSLNRQSNKTSIITVSFAIIMFVLFLIEPDFSYVILIIFITILNILTQVNKNLIIKKQLEKIDESKITYTTSILIDTSTNELLLDRQKKLNLIHLTSVSQNRFWIILTIKGGYFLLLKKDSFIKGNVEECYSELKKIQKENKKNK